ncbi:hypothetical protein M409DRAFT_66038 [Zasmidium cellare ATCC 36951]|uniref:Epoxide hydrolase N-terminal domain-containing protein n=1 Tax=Zasmidium cellare ATCC 36951 TaxID=1080233 RepID=A0A6A6CMT7_ZASCE|nr:uncharacterized protein M409DRAFT_66038 [Zasmidium cellare ATCC 36951]KAF2167470.1 hypothetical protein M409DRAFT_66038 [Zasmidium cellare ATCC 36951]
MSGAMRVIVFVELLAAVCVATFPRRPSFTDQAQPFRIDVDPEFIDYTCQKVSLTRFVAPLEAVDVLAEGPPVQNSTAIAAYWEHEYDWFAVQDRLNQRLQQFTMNIRPGPEWTRPIDLPLHFVHHVSPRPDAVPLLFIHGWPGSFIEVENIIDDLTNPTNETLPAFHVVAPSIPGYGFSPAPSTTGFGYIACAHAFNGLMQQLGYSRYVMQAGDAGGIIMRYQAHFYPEAVLAGLNNFWLVYPNSTDLERYAMNLTTPDENHVIESMTGFVAHQWGYGQIQQTRPLRLAHAMTDSPVGLAMWMFDGMFAAVENPEIWTPETVITWTMMHWIQGPYAAFRLYHEGSKDGAFTIDSFEDLPFVDRPMAISEFPKDIWYRTPLNWAQRTGNVQTRYVHSYGGHFPAWETPHELLPDIWDFLGRISEGGYSP